MKKVEALELHYAAKIKSKAFSVLDKLQQDNGCTKEEAAEELKEIILDIIALEKEMEDKFFG